MECPRCLKPSQPAHVPVGISELVVCTKNIFEGGGGYQINTQYQCLSCRSVFETRETLYAVSIKDAGWEPDIVLRTIIKPNHEEVVLDAKRPAKS